MSLNADFNVHERTNFSKLDERVCVCGGSLQAPFDALDVTVREII